MLRVRGDPFPMWPAFPTSEYYGPSATPRQQQGTVRLPEPTQDSTGTTGTLPTFIMHR
ncbi:MAG TPA: hypothetical protein VNY52_04375 [Solirubrobacteraceae bacterium]|nr:hypothetical protein [Solirubrobacteraceae bacterium]